VDVSGSVSHLNQFTVFSIDNAHPNIFIAPTDIDNAHAPTSGRVWSTVRERMNSLKAHASLVVIVVILSLVKNFLDLNSLIFNK
jgi:hypothetical protein